MDLVRECWAPEMDDRPEFAAITKRFQVIWASLTAQVSVLLPLKQSCVGLACAVCKL